MSRAAARGIRSITFNGWTLTPLPRHTSTGRLPVQVKPHANTKTVCEKPSRTDLCGRHLALPPPQTVSSFGAGHGSARLQSHKRPLQAGTYLVKLVPVDEV